MAKKLKEIDMQTCRQTVMQTDRQTFDVRRSGQNDDENLASWIYYAKCSIVYCFRRTIQNITYTYIYILYCYILGDPEVTANIYCKSRNLPIRIRKITVQICGNFWVTQYVAKTLPILTMNEGGSYLYREIIGKLPL